MVASCRKDLGVGEMAVSETPQKPGHPCLPWGATAQGLPPVRSSGEFPIPKSIQAGTE